MDEEELDSILVSLLNKGLISVEYTEDLEAVISLTPLGSKVAAQGLDITHKEN